MLQESESAELRALQGKAYGRDGGLTEVCLLYTSPSPRDS